MWSLNDNTLDFPRIVETEPDRSQKMLFLPKRRIKEGLIIMSDRWKSYDRLEDNEFGLLI